MALRYKGSLIGSILCSVMVALLWGANLGAVYPFVEVVLRNQSLHDWTDKKISESQEQIVQLEKDIQAHRSSLAEMAELERQQIEAEIRTAETDIRMHESKIETTEYFQPYIKRFAPKDPFRTLVWLVGLMILGTFMRGFALMGAMVTVARVSQRTILDIQNRVFGKVLQMEMSELDVKGTGDLISRIRGETGAIGNSVATLFGKTIREPMKMAACLIGAACVNWRLLLFSLLVCPAAGWLMIVLAKLTKRAQKKAIEESARLLNRLFQAITYMRVVKAFTMEEDESERFRVVARDVYKKSMKIAFFNSMSRMNNELLGVSMMSLSVLAGLSLIHI